MIRVFSPQLGLSPNSFLGGEVHDFNVIDGLCNLGCKIEVLLPRNREFKKNKNLKVRYLPLKSIVPPHLFNLLALPYLLRRCQEKSFDILRFHNPYFLGLAGLIIRKLYPKVKIVTTIHLSEDGIDRDFILKNTIGIYDHIFTASDYLKQWIIRNYDISPEKVSVIYNGVSSDLKPLEKDKMLVSKYNLKGKIVLLNMGLLNDRKNVLFLLNVFKKLTLKHRNLMLFFCGTGPMKSKLNKDIKNKGLEDNVVILNPVFGLEKVKTFNLADIFVFPSRNEGFGIVAAEAMACGKCVVGSNNTSLPEVIEDTKTGFLAKTNDLNDWCRKLELLLNDEKLRKNMGRLGLRKAYKNFNWSIVAKKTLKVYKEISK